jgi:hypothetical protein
MKPRTWNQQRLNQHNLEAARVVYEREAAEKSDEEISSGWSADEKHGNRALTNLIRASADQTWH